MDIGQKINDLISKKKLTKSKVASDLGIARNTLNDYISGTTKISAEDIYRLSVHYGVPVGYFFDEIQMEDIPNKPKVFLAFEISGEQKDKIIKMAMGKEFLNLLSK
jgi:transcriptional regulator with XRE-family HTH domain